MREKERNEHIGSPGGGSGDNLNELRERANRFLEAGDEAIDRALASTDSETFLRANRQQGGE